ncbi:MAG: DUF202 domain-containing protein [Lachnospiraceae bacterium]|nr:DUF202 domain-containing protein [Lachnospiraceae bacterium]
MSKKDSSKLEQKLAKERTELSYDRTGLSILRTNLAFQNSRLAVEQTHLSFLRTIVSLVGSAATIYKALPALGVSGMFSSLLSAFLMLAALLFIIKDRMTIPGLRDEIRSMEEQCDEIIINSKADLPHAKTEEG